MKKIFIVMVFPLLTFSCAPEQDLPQLEQQDLQVMKSYTEAANGVNVYDTIGSLRNTLLDSLLTTYPSSASLAELVTRLNSLAGSFPGFNALKTSHYQELTVSGLSYYLQYSGNVQSFAEELSLTESKEGFVVFGQGLLNRNADSFEDNFNWITAYEAAVVFSDYPDSEKELLLITTAIERYAVYYRKKPKDKDWDLLIGNIVATSQSASEDPATAVLYSVAFEAAYHTVL